MLAWIRVHMISHCGILSSDACCRVAVQLSVGLEVGQLVSVKREFIDRQSLLRRRSDHYSANIDITSESIVIQRPVRESTHVRAWIIAALRQIAHISHREGPAGSADH